MSGLYGWIARPDSRRPVRAVYREDLVRVLAEVAFVGALLGGVVAFCADLSLDAWRRANHEQLTREAVAKVNADLATCEQLAVRISGQPDYPTLLGLAREIDDKRRVLR